MYSLNQLQEPDIYNFMLASRLLFIEVAIARNDKRSPRADK
ncbi:hypothetical protein [Myxosarcina sp. GI1(2024)]